MLLILETYQYLKYYIIYNTKKTIVNTPKQTALNTTKNNIIMIKIL